MTDTCVYCSKTCKSRQQCLQCDFCNCWQHQTCDTGITQSFYRQMVKGTAELNNWKCYACSNSHIAVCILDEEQTVQTLNSRIQPLPIPSIPPQLSSPSSPPSGPASPSSPPSEPSSPSSPPSGPSSPTTRLHFDDDAGSPANNSFHRPHLLAYLLSYTTKWAMYAYTAEILQRTRTRTSSTKHIIFATPDQLQILKDSRAWYMDGTFSTVRKPFTQLYSIHTFLTGDTGDMKQVPVCFILMSKRRKSDYVKVLKAVIAKLGGLDDIKVRNVLPGNVQLQ